MLLTIPKRHEKSLADLVGLPAPSMRALIGSLRKAAPAVNLYDLTAQLSSPKLGLDFDRLYRVLDMLASLYRVRTDVESPVGKFVEEIVRVAKEDTSPPLTPADGDWSKLTKNLTEIFESDKSLGLTAKASELSLENERRFCPLNCRIVSDVRPVFMGDVGDKPSAAIVQHVLKLAYHEGGDLKEFFVALDGDDLWQLQDLLERAVVKEKTLREMMKSAGVPMLGGSDTSAEADEPSDGKA